MEKLVRLKKTRRLRPVRRAAWAVAVAAILVGATGTVAADGDAASALRVDNASYLRTKFGHPRLARGLLTIMGTEASDKIVLRVQGGRPAVLEVDVGDDGLSEFSFKREKIAKIAVDARAGDDLVRIDEGNGAFTDGIPTTIDGGDGSDSIAGGKGVETLLGGDGNDSIDGNGGNDLALMGSGDDVFVWDPGDGSDTVEGQAGADTMVFNGAGVAEQVDLSVSGNRLRFFRNPGTITMDTNGVERVEFNALGGSDDVTVNDLTGSGVGDVSVDLAGTPGGAAGDGQADRVTVNGTNGDDTIDVSGDTEVVKVSGAAATQILHSEVANDRLEINTLAGADTVDSSGLAAGAIQLFVDGAPVP
jgi:Ca2+-binding RTX toxin-like protein